MEESKECHQNPKERASHSEQEVASWGRYWEGGVSQLEYKENKSLLLGGGARTFGQRDQYLRDVGYLRRSRAYSQDIGKRGSQGA